MASSYWVWQWGSGAELLNFLLAHVLRLQEDPLLSIEIHFILDGNNLARGKVRNAMKIRGPH